MPSFERNSNRMVIAGAADNIGLPAANAVKLAEMLA